MVIGQDSGRITQEELRKENRVVCFVVERMAMVALLLQWQ